VRERGWDKWFDY